MTTKELKSHQLYMDLAYRISKMSYANRKKVGAIAVRDGRILSIGWNGMPSSLPNQCEHINENGVLVTNKEVLHAELNCLTKLTRSTESSEGCDLYVTLSPCEKCAHQILQSGIKNVYYAELYRDEAGLDFLKNTGINVMQLTVYETEKYKKIASKIVESIQQHTAIQNKKEIDWNKLELNWIEYLINFE